MALIGADRQYIFQARREKQTVRFRNIVPDSAHAVHNV